MVPKSRVGRAWEGSKWSLKKGLGASWFAIVGWEGSGKAKNEAWKGGLGASWLPRVGWEWFGQVKNEAKGVGCFSWFPRVGWEGLGNAKNEAWNGVWALHGSQEWGGKGLGRLKMKHEWGLGVSWLPRVGWEGWKLLLLEIPLVDESDRCGTWPDPFLNSLHELWLSFPPSQVCILYFNKYWTTIAKIRIPSWRQDTSHECELSERRRSVGLSSFKTASLAHSNRRIVFLRLRRPPCRHHYHHHHHHHHHHYHHHYHHPMDGHGQY